MKLLRRTRDDTSDSALDALLAAAFDDRLAPGAPERLYSFVRGIPMTAPATEPSPAGSIGLPTLNRLRLAGSLVATVVLVGALLLVAANRGSQTGPAAPTGSACPTASASPGCPTPSPTPVISPPTSGTFVATGSMTTPRSSYVDAVLKDGRVLIAGGLGDGPVVLTSAELYDPATGTFTATGSMVVARTGDAAALLPDGRVLIVGGMDQKGDTLASAEIYDPATGKFTATGSMKSSRAGALATTLADGRVLVVAGVKFVAGTPQAVNLTSAELFDPATGKFSPTGSMTAAAEPQCNAALLLDGRVLVADLSSGSDANGVPPRTFEAYDPKTGKFSPAGSMSNDMFPLLTVLADGRVLVTGLAPATPMTDSSAVYDPKTGAFVETGSGLLGRMTISVTRLLDGHVLVAGGQDANTNLLTSAELYDPATGNFSLTGSEVTAGHWEPAILLHDGRVLIAGGVANGHRLAAAELYLP
jgi:Kelch motif